MRTLGQQKEVFAFFFFGVLVYCAKAGRAYVTHYATVRRPYLFAIVQTRNPDSSHRDDNILKTDISLGGNGFVRFIPAQFPELSAR